METKERTEGRLRRLLEQPGTFLKWVLFAGVIGLAAGGVSSAFYYALNAVTALREANPWLLWLLPLGGVAIVLLYRICGMEKDRGTNLVLVAVREAEPMKLRTTPLIYFSTILTHLVGGSAGREGAALQLGGSMAAWVGREIRLDAKDSRVMVMCGMSAAFSALFGTPLTAVCFSMEVVSVGVMYYAALFPSILASVIAHQVALQLGGGTTAFTLSGVPENTDVLLIVKLVAFGVVCAGLSALVCIIFHKIGHLFKHFLPNQYACIAVGGAVVVLISLLLGTRDYNGAGMQVIERAIAGHAAYEAFFLKLVLTAITIGVGYKGGEIVPVLFIGATFGAAYGGFFGLAPSFAAGLGMTAVFCGVTNSPLTSILLAYELFGGQSLALFALVIAIAYMLSGYYGLYSEQKILYSKLQPRYIDRKTK